MKQIKYVSIVIICLFALSPFLWSCVEAAKAKDSIDSNKISTLTIQGTPEEIRDLFSDVLGFNSPRIFHITPINSQATSTFANAIVPDTNNAIDIGEYGAAWRNIYSSGTIYGTGWSLSGDLDPSANNTQDIGEYDLAWKDVYASGTLYASSTLVGDGKTGAPSYSFASDQDTGIFLLSANNIGLVANNGVKFSAGTSGNVSYTALYPGTNDLYDLGMTGKAWDDVMASGTIYSNIFKDLSDGTSTSTMRGLGLGVGVSPTYLLTVKPTTASDGVVITESDSNDTALLFQSGDTAGNLYVYGAGNVTAAIRGGGETVFNEVGAAGYDFRVESDTEQYMFFVDAGTNKIGVASTTPDNTFSVGGNTTVSGTLRIDNTNLVGATSTFAGSLYLGTGTPNWAVGLPQNGSLYVTSNMEVDGLTQFNNGMRFPDNGYLIFGSGDDIRIGYNASYQEPDALFLGTGGDSNGIVIAETADYTNDFGHPLQHDPTLFLHSSSTSGINEYATLNYNMLELVGYGGSVTSTFASNYIRTGVQDGYASGTFYIDSSGNVSASGTLYGGGNNLADIGAFGNAWKDIYASGTLYGGSGSYTFTDNFINSSGYFVSTDGTASSTLQKDSLSVNDTSADGVGTFYVDSSGNVNASGTFSSEGGVIFPVRSANPCETGTGEFASGTVYNTPASILCICNGAGNHGQVVDAYSACNYSM